MAQHRMLRVVKVGGSLLDLDDLADRLRCWLSGEPEASNVLVVGGGRRVDLIRAARSEPTEVEAHWLAIDAMLANSRDLLSKLPEARWFERVQEICVCSVGILNPVAFMQYDDARHPLGPLPASWSVTSDSIAARVADTLNAHELVLLKSASPTASAPLDHLVITGYVDQFFPHASHTLARVRYVNLRHMQPVKERSATERTKSFPGTETE
jgi:aspartokinase-like uncharacterized kinase